MKADNYKTIRKKTLFLKIVEDLMFDPETKKIISIGKIDLQKNMNSNKDIALNAMYHKFLNGNVLGFESSLPNREVVYGEYNPVKSEIELLQEKSERLNAIKEEFEIPIDKNEQEVNKIIETIRNENKTNMEQKQKLIDNLIQKKLNEIIQSENKKEVKNEKKTNEL